MGVVTPLPDGAYVRVSGLLFDKVWEVTLWFVYQLGAPGDFQRTVLGTTVGSWWNAGPLQYLCDAVGTTRVTVEDASSVGNLPVDAPYTPTSGSIAFDSLPANVAGVISFVVAVPPGGARGRNYLPGIPAVQVSGNVLAPSFRSSVRLAYADLIDTADVVDWTWVAVSQYHDSALRAEAIPYRVDRPTFIYPWTGQRRKRLHNEPHI